MDLKYNINEGIKERDVDFVLREWKKKRERDYHGMMERKSEKERTSNIEWKRQWERKWKKKESNRVRRIERKREREEEREEEIEI